MTAGESNGEDEDSSNEENVGGSKPRSNPHESRGLEGVGDQLGPEGGDGSKHQTVDEVHERTEGSLHAWGVCRNEMIISRDSIDGINHVIRFTQLNDAE